MVGSSYNHDSNGLLLFFYRHVERLFEMNFAKARQSLNIKSSFYNDTFKVKLILYPTGLF